MASQFAEVDENGIQDATRIIFKIMENTCEINPKFYSTAYTNMLRITLGIVLTTAAPAFTTMRYFVC